MSGVTPAEWREYLDGFLLPWEPNKVARKKLAERVGNAPYGKTAKLQKAKGATDRAVYRMLDAALIEALHEVKKAKAEA